MKTAILSAALMLASTVAMAQKSNFQLKVDLKNFNSDSVLVYKGRNVKMDTVLVKNGKFTYSANLDKAAGYVFLSPETYRGAGQLGIFQPMLTALVGLVPNCAVSVLLAQLYVQGAISFGSLFAGLTAGAGVGLAVLWRVNPSWKQNLFMTGLLWAVGAATGMLLQLLPL